MNNKQSDICCPQFDPAPWDGVELEWNAKRFIRGKVCTLFYMPLNFGSVVRKIMAKIEQADATAQDWMSLSDHTSKWSMDLYVAVDREIPNAENVVLSGKYLSKVYEGNFRETGKWVKDFENYARGRNVRIAKTYTWYTTCPKCAKKYGKNYVVIIGQIGY